MSPFEHSATAPANWQAVFSWCESLPPESTAWDEVEAFAAQLRGLAETKLSARQRQRQTFTTQLEEFLVKHDLAIQRGDLPSACLGWKTLEAVTEAQAQDALSVLGELEHLLGELTKVKRELGPEMPVESILAASQRIATFSATIKLRSQEFAALFFSPSASPPEEQNHAPELFEADLADPAEPQDFPAKPVQPLVDPAPIGPVTVIGWSSDEEFVDLPMDASEAPTPVSEVQPAPPPEKETVAPALLPPAASPIAVLSEPTSPAVMEPAWPAAASAEDVTPLAWRLMAGDHFSLAYHYLQAQENTVPTTLRPWVVRAALLGPCLRQEAGEMAGLLAADFATFDEAHDFQGTPPDHPAVRFLLFGAALLPALLAPSTDAARVLSSLHFGGGLDSLHALKEAVAEWGRNQMRLDPSSLRQVRDQAAWQGKLDALCQECAEWFGGLSARKVKFADATLVLKAWCRPSELIFSLTAPVRAGNTPTSEADLTRIHQSLGRWRDTAEIIADIQRLRTTRATIEAGARDRLVQLAREALSFVERWLSLQREQPCGERAFGRHAEALHTKFNALRGPITGELSVFEQEHPYLAVQAGLCCCRRALATLDRLFDPTQDFASEEPPAPPLVGSELLLLPRLSLDERWQPDDRDRAAIASLIEVAADGDFSYERAFDAHCAEGDHEATRRCIELARQPCGSGLEADDALLERWESRRTQGLAACRDTLAANLEETRHEIENALAFGLLPETRWREMTDELDAVGIRLQLGTIERFPPERERLAEFRAEITRKREAGANRVRERLAKLDLPADHPAAARALQSLETGDVLTANEYVDMAETGNELPVTAADPLTDFFPRAVNLLEEQLRRDKFDGLLAAARGRERFGGLEGYRGFSPQQVEETLLGLEAWRVTRMRNRLDEERLRTILTFLGFEPQNVTPTGNHRFDIQVRPVEDRVLCPVPLFGSAAGGRYRVVANFDRSTVEDLVQNMATANADATTPAIVFYFQRLDERSSRRLAVHCRERRVTFLLLDDLLVAYLSMLRGLRLATFFRCTLPFTYLSQCHTTTSGFVAPEMFYGRGRERDLLREPDGPCFLFGGRQLGKTALQRDVERAAHQPDRQRVAIWIDLLGHGIGRGRPLEDLWIILAEEFRRHGIIPPNVANLTNGDTVLRKVREWLDALPERRLLLLLDETDEFFVADGSSREPFVHTGKLKRMMDDTRRRFKVVFAGLHNVLRMTRTANHPLAHLGTPICIGPLLENGEWRAARELIETPLLAAGYRFESDDLVTRILSQTNYYPNLIQIYCSFLFDHIQSQPPTGAANAPYFTITARQLDKVYQNRALRDEIRRRLDLTLQLDGRYHVLTYVIAGATANDAGGLSLVQGFDVETIRRGALEWWPVGFEGHSGEEDFRILLDEMVGLGLLRSANGDRYTLRSANVFTLLGTRDEIENALLRATEMKKPKAYDQRVFRRPLDGAAGERVGWRSPLTNEQMAELRPERNGVCIICGHQAAGLRHLAEFLRLERDQSAFTQADDVADLGGFHRWLDERLQSHPGGTLFVPDGILWSMKWVERAAERCARLRSRKNFTSVIFAADPHGLWRLLQDVDSLEELRAMGVRLLSLQPWDAVFVGQWMADLSISARALDATAIEHKIGLWPALLEELHCSTRAGTPWQAALDQIAGNMLQEPRRAELLAGFGLDSLLPRRVVEELAQSQQVTLADLTNPDLVGYGGELTADQVRTSLEWAEWLSLVRRVGGDAWELDPTVKRLLTGRAA